MFYITTTVSDDDMVRNLSENDALRMATLLYKRFGITVDTAGNVNMPENTIEINTYEIRLCQAGDYIEAIKSYRNRHPGIRLKAAKEVIDAYRDTMPKL